MAGWPGTGSAGAATPEHRALRTQGYGQRHASIGSIDTLRIYEINTRLHCPRFDNLTARELSEIKAYGFDAIWLMGVWEISLGAASISKIVNSKYDGSPYAVPEYEFNPRLGGIDSYVGLLARAHAVGLAVFVDFVPNHMSLDSPLIDEDPDCFILSNPAMRKQKPGDYFLHRSGNVVAFGRDPYFPPWYDTSQLDYTHAGLRARMMAILERLTHYADGVRCDMAMLVLRDYIRGMWYPEAPAGWFDGRMPGEFWNEAIARAKSSNPAFIFLAETYWGKEAQLIDLGFDMVYEKELYDAMVRRSASSVIGRLRQIQQGIGRSLFFIENHDEARAASIFSRAENLSALALILSLPGSALIHEGQMQGRTVRLPVQAVDWPVDEQMDLTLESGYQQLIAITTDPLFNTGEFKLLSTGDPEVVAFIRKGERRLAAYVGQVGAANQSFINSVQDLSAIAAELGAQTSIVLKDMLTARSIVIQTQAGRFLVRPGDLIGPTESKFCLLEATPG
jgi:glycosidase